MDITAFSTRSKYAAQINAGYSARLKGQGLSTNPHIHWIEVTSMDGSNRKAGPMSDTALAWQHGWRLADRDEKGRGGTR